MLSDLKARSSAMAQTLLDALAPKTRREFVKHKHRLGRTALHEAASLDRVKVADQIIRSTHSEDRDSVINCADDVGETPLHKAKSSAMAQTLLDALAPKTSQNWMKLSNSERQGVLHASAVCDRVDVADQIFRSTDSEDRDSVISCVYDDGETPLHKAKSSAMAQTLLDALTPETKQRFIKRKDTVGMTAALSALIKEKRDVFNTIWTQSDLSTQLYLLQSHISNSGQSLLMWVSWSGDKGIVRRLLTCIQTPDSWEEIITADRKSTRLNSSHVRTSRMPSSA